MRVRKIKTPDGIADVTAVAWSLPMVRTWLGARSNRAVVLMPHVFLNMACPELNLVASGSPCETAVKTPIIHPSIIMAGAGLRLMNGGVTLPTSMLTWVNVRRGICLSVSTITGLIAKKTASGRRVSSSTITSVQIGWLRLLVELKQSLSGLPKPAFLGLTYGTELIG